MFKRRNNLLNCKTPWERLSVTGVKIVVNTLSRREGCGYCSTDIFWCRVNVFMLNKRFRQCGYIDHSTLLFPGMVMKSITPHIGRRSLSNSTCSWDSLINETVTRTMRKWAGHLQCFFRHRTLLMDLHQSNGSLLVRRWSSGQQLQTRLTSTGNSYLVYTLSSFIVSHYSI